MTPQGTIERSLESRLRELDTERIPDLELAAASNDHAAVALLASARRERMETVEAIERARAARNEPWDDERIAVGDVVELIEVGASEPERYILVWETVGQVSDGWISPRSPLGSVLVGRRRDETVTVNAPGGTVTYRITGFQRST